MNILNIEPSYNGQTLSEALDDHSQKVAYDKMINCVNSIGYSAAKRWLDSAPVSGKERDAMEKALLEFKQ